MLLLTSYVRRIRVTLPGNPSAVCVHGLSNLTQPQLTRTSSCVFPLCDQNSKVPESFPIRDAGVMAQLSLFVRENFPFVLTHRSAAHMCVMEDVTYNLVHGKGFGASRTALEQAHRKEFHAIDLICVAESKSASTIGHIGETLLQWVCPFGTLPFIGVDRRNADQTGGQERQASPRSGGRGMGTLVDIHHFLEKWSPW